eukprot:m.112689 g.112689  ORF g.112689 m.112689 type:complete len:733 (+) comp14097_c0_seq7:89-2287(+)
MANLKAPSSKSLAPSRSVVRTKSKFSVAADSRSRLRQASSIGFKDDDGEEWLTAKDPIKPDDQLDLTEAELKEEFTRILRADNPKAPDNIVRFNFKEREFKQLATVEQCDIHFAMDGNLIHNESDEARRLKAKNNMGRKVKTTKESGTGPDDSEQTAEDENEEKEDKDENPDEGVEDGVEGGDGGDGGDDAEESAEAPPEPEEEEEEEEKGPNKPLRNQFNFSERASQTFNYSLKERGVATEPPPRSDFKGSVTQWEIYDYYVADKARQDASKDKKKKQTEEKAPEVKLERTLIADENTSMWAASAKVVELDIAKKMERMVNQNTFDDVYLDFKYWNDASDEIKEDEGSLLPLWTFMNEPTKKKHVTALCFNPGHTDLLCVGYGSYNFSQQEGGGMACFSLKNPTHPEYEFVTDNGIMTLDCHPEEGNFIVAGFYDGSVAVYDLASEDRATPVCQSTVMTGMHSDPVWQVKWQPDNLEKDKNFFSISSDGRVTRWTIRFGELHFYDIIKLEPPESVAAPDGDTGSAPRAAGTSFAFNQFNEHLFLVGTEEGKVHKCSKAYSSKFLSTLNAHGMIVYAVAWNKFHPRVFATCSADWTLKIWDHEYPKPVFQFDLGNPVGDVVWAPYSSTVFAAVTTDSQVHVFDLAKAKYRPLCVQPILKKGRLTHIEFNPTHPMIVVGDDRGAVSSLKLSPNLRKDMDAKTKPTPEAQVQKLEKLLDSVKELNIETGKPITN